MVIKLLLYFAENPMKLSVDDFRQTIKKCRSRETSGDSENRSEKNPSYRQCLVTALLANEFLWFDVYAKRGTLESGYTGNHFYNKDTNYEKICFSKEQFLYDKIITAEDWARLINKEQIDILLEMNPETKKRYEILKQKFQTEIRSLFW